MFKHIFIFTILTVFSLHSYAQTTHIAEVSSTTSMDQPSELKEETKKGDKLVPKNDIQSQKLIHTTERQEKKEQLKKKYIEKKASLKKKMKSKLDEKKHHSK